MVSSGLMTTQALISGVTVCARPSGMSRPSANPPPAVAAAPITNERRLMCAMCVMAALRSRVGCRVDRRAHLLESATATDVRNRAVDVCVGRLGLLLKQRRHRHDQP